MGKISKRGVIYEFCLYCPIDVRNGRRIYCRLDKLEVVCLGITRHGSTFLGQALTGPMDPTYMEQITIHYSSEIDDF